MVTSRHTTQFRLHLVAYELRVNAWYVWYLIKGHPPRACRTYLHDKWGVGRYYLGASRERYYVGLCSRIDGFVSSMSDIIDSKLHPGLIFWVPGGSSLPSMARHHQQPCPATRDWR